MAETEDASESHGSAATDCIKGHPIPSGKKFCTVCGSPAQEKASLYCANGHEVREEDKFCSECGAAVGQGHPEAIASKSPSGEDKALNKDAMILNAEGVALPMDTFIEKMAMEHSDDRDATLAEVRAANHVEGGNTPRAWNDWGGSVSFPKQRDKNKGSDTHRQYLTEQENLKNSGHIEGWGNYTPGACKYLFEQDEGQYSPPAGTFRNPWGGAGSGKIFAHCNGCDWQTWGSKAPAKAFASWQKHHDFTTAAHNPHEDDDGSHDRHVRND
jgi:hypothetical protein